MFEFKQAELEQTRLPQIKHTHTSADGLDRYVLMSEHEWLMFGSRPRSECGCVCEPQNPWRRTPCRSWVTAFMHLLAESSAKFFCGKFMCYGSYLSFVAPLTPLLPIGRRSLDQLQAGHWDMTQGNGCDAERCRKWGDGLEKDNWEDEKAYLVEATTEKLHILTRLSSLIQSIIVYCWQQNMVKWLYLISCFICFCFYF